VPRPIGPLAFLRSSQSSTFEILPSMTHSAATEVEACLAVIGPDRSALFEQIQELKLILDVHIGEFTSVKLRDEYYDDEAGSLLEQQCGLRLREATDAAGTRTLLTFKGPVENQETDCIERLELEQPWSSEFMGEVLGHMRSRDLPFPEAVAEAGPAESMAALGLRSIQVRENSRQFALLGLPDQPIAELCLDRVTYQVGEHTIEHFELELEARGSTTAEELLTITADLEERFPGRLRSWPWPKTSTGASLGRMESREELSQHLEGSELNTDGYTRLGVYLKLEAFITQGEASA
jgi:hypothetical protein